MIWVAYIVVSIVVSIVVGGVLHAGSGGREK